MFCKKKKCSACREFVEGWCLGFFLALGASRGGEVMILKWANGSICKVV